MFKTVLTDKFKEELIIAYDYLLETSKSTVIAKRYVQKVYEKILLIEKMPYAWALVKDDFLSSIRYRSTLVENYIIFYLIDEDQKIIYIERFLSAYCDYFKIIKDDLEE